MNRAVKIRIYPNKEQRVQIEKTIGGSRFIYNQMLEDKISYYQKEKKMLRNTPAGHKKKELELSDREYVCECGNRMDRDVNAAVNIREEGKRLYKECA